MAAAPSRAQRQDEARRRKAHRAARLLKHVRHRNRRTTRSAGRLSVAENTHLLLKETEGAETDRLFAGATRCGQRYCSHPAGGPPASESPSASSSAKGDRQAGASRPHFRPSARRGVSFVSQGRLTAWRARHPRRCAAVVCGRRVVPDNVVPRRNHGPQSQRVVSA